MALADKGCPENPNECAQSCKNEGKQFDECDRLWNRWTLVSQCKCKPCEGVLISGICSTEEEAALAKKLAESYLKG